MMTGSIDAAASGWKCGKRPLPTLPIRTCTSADATMNESVNSASAYFSRFVKSGGGESVCLSILLAVSCQRADGFNEL